ncbi:MAG: LolA family protein [Paracoccaceae bacterium]
MPLTRRSFLAALPLTALAVQAQAQAIPLAEISRYLNALQSARAEFTQIADDGTISTGQLLIKRPGRIRFEYAPPDESLVMASGGQLAVFDPRSNTPADRYPLSQTPLSIILQRNVDLGRAGMVTAHTSDGTTTTVRAQDPDNPQYGHIDLVFTEPTQLRQWIVTDDTGARTTIILGDLDRGMALGDGIFNIQAEMARRG